MKWMYRGHKVCCGEMNPISTSEEQWTSLTIKFWQGKPSYLLRDSTPITKIYTIAWFHRHIHSGTFLFRSVYSQWLLWHASWRLTGLCRCFGVSLCLIYNSDNVLIQLSLCKMERFHTMNYVYSFFRIVSLMNEQSCAFPTAWPSRSPHLNSYDFLAVEKLKIFYLSRPSGKLGRLERRYHQSACEKHLNRCYNQELNKSTNCRFWISKKGIILSSNPSRTSPSIGDFLSVLCIRFYRTFYLSSNIQKRSKVFTKR